MLATLVFPLTCLLSLHALPIPHSIPAVNHSTAVAAAYASYEIEEHGSLFSSNYALYFKGSQGYISPWHDIPLYADEAQKVYNMIVEIPRWTNAKMEMHTRDPLNPIKQDSKSGAPRFVNNIFPYTGYLWNYGALPQTWENNQHVDNATGTKGDNDPIDVIEIGSAVFKRGAVVQVKLLGCLALLDSNETDWKLVAIDIRDPVASNMTSMDDVQKQFPGLLDATRYFFRMYKVPTGASQNAFGYDGAFLDADFCHNVINETNSFWKQLLAEPYPSLNTANTLAGGPHQLTQEEAASVVAGAPPKQPDSRVPEELNKWYYLDVSKTTAEQSVFTVFSLTVLFSLW